MRYCTPTIFQRSTDIRNFKKCRPNMLKQMTTSFLKNTCRFLNKTLSPIWHVTWKYVTKSEKTKGYLCLYEITNQGKTHSEVEFRQVVWRNQRTSVSEYETESLQIFDKPEYQQRKPKCTNYYGNPEYIHKQCSGGAPPAPPQTPTFTWEGSRPHFKSASSLPINRLFDGNPHRKPTNGAAGGRLKMCGGVGGAGAPPT